MKTININLTIVSILFAITFASPSIAQSIRPISKDVQRVSSRWLQTEKLFTVASIDSYAGTSKEVVFINSITRRASSRGNIRSIGTPSWLLSKPVHQQLQQVNSVRLTHSPSQGAIASK
jgi:hypothetical protein